MKKKNIPTTNNGWLDYNDYIIIIKEDYKEKESMAHFQYDGVMCKQGMVTGKVVDRFQSESKYFDYNWWYETDTIDSEKIFKEILKEVKIQTGKEYVFPYANLNYGDNWWEAKIPLEYKGDRYLLTWHNCD